MLKHSLFQIGRTYPSPIWEVKHFDPKLFQIIIFWIPIIPDHKDINIQFLYSIFMIKCALWNNQIRVTQTRDDCNPFFEGDDWRFFIA
ncbi:hypothetical protein BJD16_03595 [Aeromonas sobria]|uniref:Transposase n=1 Tax=Aeromonas sobria TaxID=646 RepID=A0A1S2CX85_AERSO|nr:hypothetical protein BJD16_03595 [Aeromonas sobria]